MENVEESWGPQTTSIVNGKTSAGGQVAQAGAKIGDGVTRQTTLLIYGEKAGSKLAAAKKLNIALMSEAEMVAQLTRSPAAQASLGAAAEKIDG